MCSLCISHTIDCWYTITVKQRASFLSTMQGLPPLSKLPNPTPGVPAPERRTTLPPLRGDAIGTQARRALGDTTLPTSGSTLPGQLLPRSLPPTSPGAPPFIGKGKGPLSGRPVIKKFCPLNSSEEDISGSEMVGAALPTITSPPFKTTRPLLPPIEGTSHSPIRKLKRVSVQ